MFRAVFLIFFFKFSYRTMCAVTCEKNKVDHSAFYEPTGNYRISCERLALRKIFLEKYASQTTEGGNKESRRAKAPTTDGGNNEEDDSPPE